MPKTDPRAPYGYKLVQPWSQCWTLIRVPRTREEYLQKEEWDRGWWINIVVVAVLIVIICLL